MKGMGRTWNKAGQGGASSNAEPENADPSQNRQIIGRAEQIVQASQDQDHDMNRIMQGYWCGVGPFIPDEGQNQSPEEVGTGQ